MSQWRKNLYLTKADAVELGMTHEGTLFGLPVYLGEVDNPEQFLAIPKIPVLVLWTVLCSKLFDFFAMFCHPDTEIVTPVVVGDQL